MAKDVIGGMGIDTVGSRRQHALGTIAQGSTVTSGPSVSTWSRIALSFVAPCATALPGSPDTASTIFMHRSMEYPTGR